MLHLEVQLLASEDIREELWSRLGQYAYRSYTERYFTSRGISVSDEGTYDFIAGCSRQGQAYFRACSQTPVDIRPLLLYYGATNLMAMLVTLRTATVPSIHHHGMELDAAGANLADFTIRVLGRPDGGLGIFASTLGTSIPGGSRWTISEVLGMVPDLRTSFEGCYDDRPCGVLPIERIEQADRVVERIRMDDLSRFSSPESAFSEIENFSTAYVAPQLSDEFVFLNRRLRSDEIGVYSIQGRKYLALGHRHDSHLVTPDTLLVLLMGSYAFGYLSRYRPSFWNPFVRGDATGQLGLAERFFSICERYIPNLVLSHIVGKRMQFVPEVR